MWLPAIFWNSWIKWVWWVWALEWINQVVWNLSWLYSPEVWDTIWAVAWAVQGWLEASGVNWYLASNPLVSSAVDVWTWLWWMALSNSVLKDFWLVSEWNTWGLKNMTRYAINWAAWATAFAAWSAALPYIIWGWAVYWAWKKGWVASKETLKWLYSWIWWVAKNIITSPIWGYKAIKNSFWAWNFKKNPQTN